MEWIDISLPLHDGMVHWPDDPPAHIEKIHDIARGDNYTLSTLSMSSHAGTHIDAPSHCLKDGVCIDGMPLDAGIGRARVIDIHDKKGIGLSEVKRRWTRRYERILFKTRNSTFIRGASQFVPDFVYLTDEAARFLVDRGVKLVGIDYLSVGGYRRGGDEVHRILLEAGVWILEGLDLSRIPPGEYDMICLPLRLQNGDGSPARVVLRPL